MDALRQQYESLAYVATIHPNVSPDRLSAIGRLLGLPATELTDLATAAAHRGQIVFMNAGGIKEVRFDGFLTKDEEALLHE